MFAKISRLIVTVLVVGSLAGVMDAEAARSKRKSPAKRALKTKSKSPWISARKNKKKKQRSTASSRKRSAYVSQPVDRSPAAVREAKRKKITKKYADLKRKLKEQQLKREEQLMRDLESEDRVGVRMENLRALQMGFQSEQEELDLQEAKEFCRDLNAECHRIPGYQLANSPDFVPSFAQDTGFRND